MDRYKTIINRKNIIILVSILIVCAGMFLFRQVEDTGFTGLHDSRKALETYIDVYGGTDFATAYNMALEDRKNNYSDKVMRMVCDKLEYLSGYEAYVDSIISNAETMSRRKLFATQGGYRLKNIIRTMQDYQRIKDTVLIFDNDRGIEAFFEYKALYYFIAAAMLTVVMMMVEFNSSKSRNITYYCPDGRGRLGISHLVQLFVMQLLVSAVIYAVVFLEAFAVYGACDLSAPIQSTELFKDYTFAVSRGEYILINYVQLFIIVYMLSLVLWVFLNSCNASSLGIIALCMLMGVEVLLYVNIEPKSRWELLRKINVVNLLYVPGLNTRYANADIFGVPFSFIGVIIVCSAILITAFSIAGVLMEAYRKPVEEYPSGIKGQLAKKLHDIASKSTVFIKELYKPLITRKALVIGLFFYVTAICFINDSKVHIGDNQISDDKMFMEIGEKGVAGLREKYEELDAQITQILDDMSTADSRLAIGEITEDEYMSIYTRYMEVENKKTVKLRLQNKLSYLEEVEAVYGIQAVVIPENGYNNAIGKGSIKRELIIGILFTVAIWVIVVDYFAYERALNSGELFYMMKKGGTWLYAKRILVCLTLTVIMFLLVYGYDIARVLRWYDMPFSGASAMNLSFMGDSGYTGSIKGYAVLLIFERLAAGIAVCLCAAAFSIRFGQKAQAGVIPAVGTAVMAVLLAFSKVWLISMLAGFTLVTVVMAAAGGRMWCRRWE